MIIEKYISRLNVDGIQIKEQKEIEHPVLRFYRKLYKSQETEITGNIEQYLVVDTFSINKLSDRQKLSCEGLLTIEEIDSYLKRIRNNKSPGTSGYTGEFYKFFY